MVPKYEAHKNVPAIMTLIFFIHLHLNREDLNDKKVAVLIIVDKLE